VLYGPPSDQTGLSLGFRVAELEAPATFQCRRRSLSAPGIESFRVRLPARQPQRPSPVSEHLEGCLMVYTTPKVVYTTLGIYHGIYTIGRWCIPTVYIPWLYIQ
jgi:hypothetical protein